MKTLFHTNTLNFRGTTVAVQDYAKFNQEILGNESVICYNASIGYEKDMGSEQSVVDELSKMYDVRPYDTYEELETITSDVDFAYFIRGGQQEPTPTNTKTGIHAVFGFDDPHGDRYAYVSEWLSKEASGGKHPFVPHMVDLPKPTGDFREALGLNSDDIVIGRIGGYYTFDLPWVYSAITSVVEKNPKVKFLFVGTYPFIDHPNVRFINEFSSRQKKSNFINTCDAMIHGRSRGETFGLSIVEGLALDRPVFAWENGAELNHRVVLGGDNSNLLYNESNLVEKLLNVKKYNESGEYSALVKDYLPEPVMKKFKEVYYD
jgi:glycosyltransferase involved in cell wall biosynthesis